MISRAKRFQKTIAKAGSIVGLGIHSGKKTTLRLEPAPVGQGIQFFQKGVAVPETILNTSRCTSIGTGTLQVQTVEHLLAALSGLEITNIRIEVDGEEIPGLDGSALEFVNLFKNLGIEEQKEEAPVFKIKEPVFFYENQKALAAYPDDAFSVAYTLDYPHPLLRAQTVDFKLTPDTFVNQIAPARTFCTSREAEEVQKNGKGLGATLNNTLVIGDEGPLGNQFRFPDECARHKVLDIIGDLYLLGFPIQARVIGLRSGHSLNRKLVEYIKKQQRGES